MQGARVDDPIYLSNDEGRTVVNATVPESQGLKPCAVNHTFVRGPRQEEIMLTTHRPQPTNGNLQSNILDPYVVVTQPCGSQGAYGYWVQPVGDGRTGYLQPVWMAC